MVITIKPKKSTVSTTRIIISTVGIAVILGLSALLVVPSLQNQAFADSLIEGGLRGTFTCSGQTFEESELFFQVTVDTAQGATGDANGGWEVFDQRSAPLLSGRFDEGTVTPSENFNLRGSVHVDQVCGPFPQIPYNMHIIGECGNNADIKLSTEEGEKGTFSGTVTCTSTN